MAIALPTEPALGRTMWGRAIRFMARVGLGVLSAWFVVGAALNPSLIPDKETLRHPILTAMDAVGAFVQQTEVSVWAPVSGREAPSLGELKQLAASIAAPLARDARDPVELWSESTDAYRVVYYSGGEEHGGRWTASARHLVSEAGSTEVALHRLIYGAPDDLRAFARWSRGRLSAAAGSLLRPVERVKVSARPAREEDFEQLARALLAAAGAEVRFVSRSDGALTLGGYTPRLSGSERLFDQTINLMVRISTHGRGGWIEMGYPSL